MDDLAAAVAALRGQAPIRLDQTDVMTLLVRHYPVAVMAAMMQADGEVLTTWRGPPLTDHQLGLATTAKLLRWMDTLGIAWQGADGGRA